jgi:hypothetical protein
MKLLLAISALFLALASPAVALTTPQAEKAILHLAHTDGGYNTHIEWCVRDSSSGITCEVTENEVPSGLYSNGEQLKFSTLSYEAWAEVRHGRLVVERDL